MLKVHKIKSAFFKFTCNIICLPDIRRCFDGDPGQVYKNDLSVSKKEFRKYCR